MVNAQDFITSDGSVRWWDLVRTSVAAIILGVLYQVLGVLDGIVGIITGVVGDLEMYISLIIQQMFDLVNVPLWRSWIETMRLVITLDILAFPIAIGFVIVVIATVQWSLNEVRSRW